MNIFEQLEQEAFEEGADIDFVDFASPRIKGLYCDGSIAINKNLDTTAEIISIVGEELGHHLTSSGIIINMASEVNRKQELRARLWAYDRLIGLSGLIKAYEHGCHGKAETADFLEITEIFLEEAVKCYESKYDKFTVIDNYIIRFIPTLGVAKMF